MLLRGMNVSCLRLWKVSLLSPCWQAHEVNYYSVAVLCTPSLLQQCTQYLHHSPPRMPCSLVSHCGRTTLAPSASACCEACCVHSSGVSVTAVGDSGCGER